MMHLEKNGMSSILRNVIAVCTALFEVFAFGASAVAEDDAVKIGLLTPKSGPLAGPGKQMEDGIRFFLKAHDNILAGRKVTLLVADTFGQPAMALTKAQELVERERVDILVGPLATTEALAINDYIQQAKVPIISSSAAAEDITQRAPNPWLLRATGSAGQFVHHLGHYAATTLKYKRIATVATDFGYGHEVVGAFHRVFEDNGGHIVQKIWVPLKVSDFAAYIALIKRDVDAVFVSFSGSSATAFIRQYREFGLKDKLPLLASLSTVDESLLPQLGDDAVGIISGSIYSAAIDSPENKAYVAAYRKEYKVDPGYYATGAYMAGTFIQAALKATNGNVEDKQALIKALRAIELKESPRGRIRIDEFGNPISDLYIDRTKMKNGHLQNVVIKVYPMVSQFWTYDPKQYLSDPVYSRDYPPAKHIEN